MDYQEASATTMRETAASTAQAEVIQEQRERISIDVISRGELVERMDRGDDFILVEALPTVVYNQARLPGAINLPLDQVSEMAPKLFPDRSTDLVVYCAGPRCISSRRAVRELMALGYTRVRHYLGGKKDWFDAGLRIEVISTSRNRPRKNAL